MYYLLNAIQTRQNHIFQDIMNNKIQIQRIQKLNNQQNKVFQLDIPKKHLINQTHDQEAFRKYKEFLKQEQIQKKRIQSLKQKEILQRQLTIKKQQQEQTRKKQQLKREHTSLVSEKIKKSQQQRQKQRKLRNQRNNQLKYILKSHTSITPLHQKMRQQYLKKRSQQNQHQLTLSTQQKQSYNHNMRIQDMKIIQHEKKYLEWKEQNQAGRYAKRQEIERVEQLYQKDLERKYGRRRFNRDVQNQNQDQDQQQDRSHQSTYLPSFLNPYKDPKQEYHKIADQKRKKMENYWESFVKVSQKPKVDPHKREELLNLIKSLDNNRKMKKVKNEKGEYVLEQVKPLDPTMKGLQYLQHSRQIGRLRKLSRQQKSSRIDQKSQVTLQVAKKKPQDYLKQVRQSRSLSTCNPTLQYLSNKSIPFNQKLQRVQRQTFKLQQSTRLSQQQLKYGKFKTSEEILSYKESIDQNHLEILRIKLKLAGL